MNRLFLAAGVSLTFLQLVAPARAITIRDDRPDSAYLALGAQYPAVGVIDGGNATLITSEWVLTAAHVGVQVVPGNTTPFILNGTSYDIAQVVIHPNYSPTTLSNDIALVRLTTPILSVTPMAYNTAGVELGQLGISVGHGNTGTGLTGDNQPSGGLRRGAENRIDIYGNGVNTPGTSFLMDFDRPGAPLESVYGSPLPENLEGMAALFDSGGPVIVNFGSGPVIAGVISYRGAPDGTVDSDYGDIFGATRVALYANFISSQIPEPGTMALFGLGAVAFGFRAWRRRG